MPAPSGSERPGRHPPIFLSLAGNGGAAQDRAAFNQLGIIMIRIDPRAAGALALLTTVAACAAPPPGPTIPVAPGPGKSFDAFAADQNFCAQYAAAQTAPAAAAANQQAVGGALLSTALGAAIGGAVGGGRGAGIGAASGAGLGTIVGASNSSYAQMSIQQQYDAMYGACMQAHGNQVPGFAPPPGAPPYAGGGGPPGYGGPPPGYAAPPPGYGAPPPGYPPY
jgi:hypothetical protein